MSLEDIFLQLTTNEQAEQAAAAAAEPAAAMVSEGDPNA
jgi:hypothetical protein